jgi:hypothetical protein
MPQAFKALRQQRANVIANIDVACRLARGSRRGWTTRWRHAEAPCRGAEGEALKG